MELTKENSYLTLPLPISFLANAETLCPRELCFATRFRFKKKKKTQLLLGLAFLLDQVLAGINAFCQPLLSELISHPRNSKGRLDRKDTICLYPMLHPFPYLKPPPAVVCRLELSETLN